MNGAIENSSLPLTVTDSTATVSNLPRTVTRPTINVIDWTHNVTRPKSLSPERLLPQPSGTEIR